MPSPCWRGFPRECDGVVYPLIPLIEEEHVTPAKVQTFAIDGEHVVTLQKCRARSIPFSNRETGARLRGGNRRNQSLQNEEIEMLGRRNIGLAKRYP